MKTIFFKAKITFLVLFVCDSGRKSNKKVKSYLPYSAVTTLDAKKVVRL